MDAPQPATLEATITEVGVLLVQLHKFRAGVDLHPGLLATALDIGDRARRRHHRRTLDDGAAAGLLGEALALRRQIEEELESIRGGATYRAAVTAHTSGDHERLADLLPRIFGDLEPVSDPPLLWHALPWLRRNRPRPAADLAAAVERLAAEGLEGDTDPLAPGIDPDLPAVPLDTGPMGGEPLLLRYQPAVLPAAVYRLRTSQAIVVHVARLRTPFEVVLLDALDDDELGGVTLDYPRYRTDLAAALAAVGRPVTGG